MRKPHTFTIKEYRFIEANYRTMSDRQIGAQLGLSAISVKNLRQRQGWKKEPHEIVSNKGQIPWNKGKKGVNGMSDTRFKKGQMPVKPGPIGAPYIVNNKGTQYYYVRTGINQRRLLHHVVWEQHNGLIPKNSIVRFRNGNTLDCSIDNLWLVSRSENCKLNSNPKKGGESMRKVWQVVKTLEANNIKFSKYKLTSFRKKVNENVKSIPTHTRFA